jgi:SAM-dependent methyltransferase
MDGLLTVSTTTFALIVILAAALWLIVPLVTGLPWVPTRERRIHKALQLADVKPGDVLYDLGAGDGRVLLAAARDFGARAIGIEISPVHCLIAWLRARLSGVGRKVTIRWGSFYNADYSDADVVFAYMTMGQAARLRPHLESRLKPGARIVTISSDLDGWEPEKIDQNDLVFLYRMPPTPGDIASFFTKSINENGIQQTVKGSVQINPDASA